MVKYFSTDFQLVQAVTLQKKSLIQSMVQAVMVRPPTSGQDTDFESENKDFLNVEEILNEVADKLEVFNIVIDDSEKSSGNECNDGVSPRRPKKIKQMK